MLSCLTLPPPNLLCVDIGHKIGYFIIIGYLVRSCISWGTRTMAFAPVAEKLEMSQ